MMIDSRTYSGACSCGRDHEMVTRAVIIERDCLYRFESYMEQYGISGKRCVLYGENSYRATEGKHPVTQQEIILSPIGLHADEKSTAVVLERLEPDVEVLIAVGSGTIHDIARFCAHERRLRFVSVPTAASVDGFCSTVAAMTWYGFKKTLTAVAPEIVVADSNIIKNAPPELVRSGVGDIMAKYTALADWEIAHVTTGEYLCPRIHKIMKDAADTVMDSVPGILAGETEAYENVTYALIMSGIAMQMMGNSRPASGADHHISHLIEMGPKELEVKFPALHGEKTGVGTVVAAREYYRMIKTEDISNCVVDYAPVSEEKYRNFFGPNLADAIIKENENDCLHVVTPEKLKEVWPEIRRIVSGIPAAETLYGILEQLDAKRELEDIGVSSAQLDALLEYSPLVRDRLTLMRMRRMIRC